VRKKEPAEAGSKVHFNHQAAFLVFCGMTFLMTDTDLLAVKLLHDNLGQLQAGGDVGGWFANLLRNLLDAIPWLIQIEKPFEAPRLLQWMHVAALKVRLIFSPSEAVHDVYDDGIPHVVELLSVVVYDVDQPAWAR